MAKDYSGTTVIIPTLNEARSIGKLIRLISNLYPGISVIVVDDGSSDGTVSIVSKIGRKKSRIRVIDRRKEKIHGLTASVIVGLEQTRAKYAVIMDGDLQHPPEKIRSIVAGLGEGNEIVVGVRVSVADNWPMHRRLMSVAASGLGFMRLLPSGNMCNDILSGFFGIRVDFAKKLIKKYRGRFSLEGYKALFDFLKAAPAGISIMEIPYSFGEREGGSSKINLRHIAIYGKSLFK
ncbi:MAG: glycosyltransferase [Candidatus Micrarchaeota archaeon]